MVRGALLAAALVAALAGPLRGQTLSELTASPDATAESFLGSLRAIRWSTAAQLVHPVTLDRFRTLVSMIAEADTTGEVARYLTGTDAEGLSRLDAADVFARAVGSMMEDLPGLTHAFFDRDDEVLGHVVEGADSAHVVYRTSARIGGAVPEVKVMQLARPDDGWRVLWSDELEVLDAALRGVSAGRR